MRRERVLEMAEGRERGPGMVEDMELGQDDQLERRLQQVLDKDDRRESLLEMVRDKDDPLVLELVEGMEQELRHVRNMDGRWVREPVEE